MPTDGLVRYLLLITLHATLSKVLAAATQRNLHPTTSIGSYTRKLRCYWILLMAPSIDGIAVMIVITNVLNEALASAITRCLMPYAHESVQ